MLPFPVRIDGLRDGAAAWHIPPSVQILQGARLLVDAPRGSGAVLATVRSIVRSNPRIGPMDALRLAVLTHGAARRAGLDEFFLAAMLLQESAYAPDAMSSAGAVGIAQFTIPTASLLGVNPFEPRSAIEGAAQLIATYLHAYRDRDDPFALALAAYNAGPGAVAYYHGVPPYAETREYIIDVRERWARLVTDAAR
jgi:soluble lytic murein transglycosylase-like protein